MKRSSKILGLLIGLGLLLALSGCRHPPDEVQVRDAVAAMTKAAQGGAAGDLVAPLSEDFDGNGGELDRSTLGNLVRVAALRGEHVGVTVGPIAIEHRGERMLATFTLTLRSGGQLWPDQLGIYRVESAWRREGGRWRCYSASWKRSL